MAPLRLAVDDPPHRPATGLAAEARRRRARLDRRVVAPRTVADRTQRKRRLRVTTPGHAPGLRSRLLAVAAPLLLLGATLLPLSGALPLPVAPLPLRRMPPLGLGSARRRAVALSPVLRPERRLAAVEHAPTSTRTPGATTPWSRIVDPAHGRAAPLGQPGEDCQVLPGHPTPCRRSGARSSRPEGDSEVGRFAQPLAKEDRAFVHTRGEGGKDQTPWVLSSSLFLGARARPDPRSGSGRARVASWR